MNCKMAQELIFADYVDGVLDDARLKELNAHIDSCADCRTTAKHVIEAGRAVKGIGRQAAPAGMWEKVRMAIEEDRSRKPFMAEALDRIHNAVCRLRPAAPVLAAALALILVFAAVDITSYRAALAERDETAALAALNGDDDADYNIGTAAEEYFL